MSVSVCMYVLLEYLSDIYLLFSLPHIHMHITQIHPVVFFWCITSVVLLLIPSFPSITTGLHHTSCLRACMRVCLLIGALPCQSHRSPASSPPRCLVIGSALADGGGGGRGCCHLLYLCRPPLSPEPVSSPAWNRQILPHLSWQCSCPSVCNTLTCMRTYININIYIYVHTVHIWVASTDPGVCCSTNSVQQVFQTMDQHLTADMAKLVIFSFFHFYHTPRGTNRHFRFCFYLETWNHSEGRGGFVTLQRADWTQRKLSEDSWKLGLQWKPFWPDWVRSGLLWVATGRWMNSKRVSSIRLWICFHPGRGEGRSECGTVQVAMWLRPSQ